MLPAAVASLMFRIEKEGIYMRSWNLREPKLPPKWDLFSLRFWVGRLAPQYDESTVSLYTTQCEGSGQTCRVPHPKAPMLSGWILAGCEKPDLRPAARKVFQKQYMHGGFANFTVVNCVDFRECL